MQTIYLGLGSNLGERAANLRAAVRALAPQVSVLSESSLYETPPWGIETQPGFSQAVARRSHSALRAVGTSRDLGRTPTSLGRA
jgi:2-amino-4-hydroxy-6-hydroxymethyldihydropteridine diphosphokinase